MRFAKHNFYVLLFLLYLYLEEIKMNNKSYNIIDIPKPSSTFIALEILSHQND